MIVWHGRGAIVAAVAFGCLLVSELICRAYFHDDKYYQQHGWPKLAAFLVAAGVGWLLQRDEHAEVLEVANRQVAEGAHSQATRPPVLCARQLLAPDTLRARSGLLFRARVIPRQQPS